LNIETEIKIQKNNIVYSYPDLIVIAFSYISFDS